MITPEHAQLLRALIVVAVGMMWVGAGLQIIAAIGVEAWVI